MKNLREEIEIMKAFAVIFQTTSKFVIVFVRLILRKGGVDAFTGPRQEIDIR